jgi:DivIVA domain-containing protein
MVLVVELLLGVGILVGAYRVATSDRDLAPTVEPDGPAPVVDQGPLSADELVAFRLPWGIGYRKADVDRLLDRVARQLPRAGERSPGDVGTGADEPGRVALTKSGHVATEHGFQEHGSQEDGHG